MINQWSRVSLNLSRGQLEFTSTFQKDCLKDIEVTLYADRDITTSDCETCFLEPEEAVELRDFLNNCLKDKP